VLNGTPISIGVNATTNRLSSASYDANGNMTSGAGGTLGYDEANRMVSFAPVSGGTEYYAYAPDNKRIYRLKADGVTEELTLYGARGEKVGVYSIVGATSGGIGIYMQKVNMYFGGRLIWEGSAGVKANGGAVFQDRLGTNRASGARFRPYGDEITSTSNDREKFATYNRDGFSGLDYADQRYYASAYGRFDTVDPWRGSAQRNDPGTWNRYSYVAGDPVNRADPRGLGEGGPPDIDWCAEMPEMCTGFGGGGAEQGNPAPSGGYRKIMVASIRTQPLPGKRLGNILRLSGSVVLMTFRRMPGLTRLSFKVF
jgi:RHS repeat-associated protein